jgi:hypothetical protein
MRAAAAILTVFVSLLLAGPATARTKLQDTVDGKTLVGHTRNGFRIVSHHIDVRMKAPRGWRVVLCTEEPLKADVVCISLDKNSLASVIVREASAGDRADAPDDYLRQLRRFKDAKIEMRPANSVVLADRRRLTVWNFSSENWGQHFYVRIPAETATVEVEVESHVPMSDASALRRVLQGLARSYRSKPAKETR